MSPAPDLATVFDRARLNEWMEAAGLGRGEITNPVLLAGGTQNILVRFTRGGRDYVMRRPPPNPRPESNETMRREARVLGALAGTDVPHPGLVAACPDDDVLGVAFYLMDPIEGFNATTGLPALHANDPAIRRRMGIALAEGAAAIAQVDFTAVGLADFGRTENFLSRQAGRWQKQLDSYCRFENWPGADELPGVSEIAAYLQERCPTTFRPGLMHGDYTLTNVMYRPDSGEIAAIIDWELCTIGDPIIDLGWLLATWNGVPPIDLNVLQVEPWSGFPRADEMIAHYHNRTGANLDNLDWYFVLACYKLGIILEGTFARACAGRDPMETGAKLHEAARRLMLRAQHRIS